MHNQLNIIVSAIIEDPEVVLDRVQRGGFSEQAQRKQAWIHFCDFLDDCEGTCM